jgi:hypothetical protein
MITAWILALCVYSINFVGIWQVSTCCGVVLSIEAILFVWKKRPLKWLYRMVLIGVTCLVGLWSFALSYAASRNTLYCAGVQGASADLIRRAGESYHILTLFQILFLPTLFVTIGFFLAGMLILRPPSRDASSSLPQA